MDTEKKRRIIYEVMVLLGILALMVFALKLWPILLLVITCIPICALRLLFIRAKAVEPIATTAPIPESLPETENSIIQKAFGLLQRRITAEIRMQYPDARWVWGVSNAIECFKNGQPLIILLNSAGGYNKAQVIVHNLMFEGLCYKSVSSAVSEIGTQETELPADTNDVDTDDACPEPLPDDAPINYGRLAFEWVDTHISEINAKYNESIAQNQSEMLIHADSLPHPDSLPHICEELRRSGFPVAELCEDGINVNANPKNTVAPMQLQERM